METDESGNFILDDDGNPVLTKKRDADGNLILDENGKPMISGIKEEVVYVTVRLAQVFSPDDSIIEQRTKRFPAAFLQLIQGYTVDMKPIVNQAGMDALLSGFNLKTA
jgi:hypothetical protein